MQQDWRQKLKDQLQAGKTAEQPQEPMMQEPAGMMEEQTPEIMDAQEPMMAEGFNAPTADMVQPGANMMDQNQAIYDSILGQPEQQPGGAAANGVDPIGNGLAMSDAIGEEQVIEAELVLQKYKAGKHHLERKIIHNQQWWKLHNWEEIEGQGLAKGSGTLKSNSALLWNCVVGKHADAMDAYPEPIVLPRAADDEEEAKRLSEIIPVAMEMNDFERTYSDCAWQKLIEGTACYSVLWDQNKLNGLGDISINRVNILNLFWEPGINDIQDSRHLFVCALEDNDMIEQQYPELAGKVKGSGITLAKYMYDDSVDTSNKSVVVDWYYHKYDGQKKLLHYCKFVAHNVIYATENDPQYAGRGLYDDGKFPFVLDVLYPVEGSPCGVGLIDIGRGAQTDIDVMNQAMVRSTTMASTPRYFIRSDGSVNEEEFADWTKPLVHVNGNLGQDSVAPINANPLAELSVSFLQQKIEELKFVTGNVDVNNGSTPSGVTAASAIAALKEDAGRSSKDSNKASYRSYRELVTMVIERIRQFYDMPRQFRIVGDRGEATFQQYDNTGLQMQQQQSAFGEDMGMRLPVFDVMVRAQRENAYTKTAQNELAIQFYQLGFFNPQMADASLMCLDMMDFRGKEDLISKIQEGQTMQQMVQQMTQLATEIAANNGDEQGLAAIEQVAMGAGMEPSMGAVPQTQKLGNVKEGEAETGGTKNESAMPAGQGKRLDAMRERMNNAKRPV